MKSMKFADIVRSPLYQTENIDGVREAFYKRSNRYFLGEELNIPVRPVNQHEVSLDVEMTFHGGMTPGGSSGVEAPLLEVKNGRGKRTYEAPLWKEKVRVTAKDLEDIRKLGTHDELVAMNDVLRQKQSVLRERLEVRMEWLRRGLIFDQQITHTTEGGHDEVYSYTSHPSYMRPTAGVLWNVTATADPVADLLEWAETFRRHSVFRLSRGYVPLGTLRLLTDLDRFNDIMINSHGSFDGSREAIKAEITKHTGITNLMESDHHISGRSYLTAASAQSDTVLDVYGGMSSVLEADDEIVVHDPATGYEEILTVASVDVDAGTITVDAPGVARAAGMAAGDLIYWSKFIIPADKILLVGDREGDLQRTGSSGLSNDEFVSGPFADILSTISMDSSLQNPQPGPFRKMIDRTGSQYEIESIEEILGVRAIPRLHAPTAFMVAEFL